MQHLTLAKGGSFGDADEADLAEAARQDAAAFTELYRRYVTRVYRYLFSHVGEADDAEDLTSQVFGAAWESLSRYREQGTFAAWLFRIARNKLNDFYRRNRRHVPLEQVEGRLHVEWDPFAHLEMNDALQRLSNLVRQLEDEHIEMLRLRFAADLSYAEMGRLLGRSEDAVKMAMHRLLRRLQDNMERYDE